MAAAVTTTTTKTTTTTTTTTILYLQYHVVLNVSGHSCVNTYKGMVCNIVYKVLII